MLRPLINVIEEPTNTRLLKTICESLQVINVAKLMRTKSSWNKVLVQQILWADHTVSHSKLTAIRSSSWWSMLDRNRMAIASLQVKCSLLFIFDHVKQKGQNSFPRVTMFNCSGTFAGWWKLKHHNQMSWGFQAHENLKTLIMQKKYYTIFAL